MTTSETKSPDDWRKALLPIDSTVRQSIRNLDESTMQIAIVVSTDGSLVGTLTDGDIRRALLRGLTLESPIESIIHRDPFVVPPQLHRSAVLELMQANKVRQLPVVDGEGRVIGMHLWDELLVPKRRSNLMLVMAGGLGARLRPETDNCPKPLLPVAGKPILEHILERARTEGFENFVFAVHYLGHMIEEHFGDGSNWGVRIDYLREQTPLGTAGAISLLKPRPTGSFIVSNGDVLSDVRYAEVLDFHCRHGAAATMAVRLYEWQHPFGVVRTNGVDIVGFEEKPIHRTHINAGIYALDPSALDSLTVGERCDMPTLFYRLQENSARTIVYPIHEPWLDVGVARDYKSANETVRGVSS